MLGQNSVYYYIEIDSNTTNHTEVFRNAIEKSDKIFIPKGKYYLEYDKLKTTGSIELCGEKGTVIEGIGNAKFNSLKPLAIFEIINPEDVYIHEISFTGKFNVATAISLQQSLYDSPNNKTNVTIENNSVSELGLVWIGPKNGFTFNRLHEEYENWAQSGPINTNNWVSNIKIKNNKCIGDKTFYSGNFRGSSISAITMLYSNNMLIEFNIISNYRFGIWSYGGASKSRNGNKLSKNNILSKNIKVNNNHIEETYSPIWFSRTKNVEVYDNLTINNQDVALDVEGCQDVVMYNNTVKNSRGGALVTLNGSKNVIFKHNNIYMENYNKHNNIVFIRDGNSDIEYLNNYMEFNDNRIIDKRNARVFIKNSSIEIPSNVRIIFKNNELNNVGFDVRNGGQIQLNNNKFRSNITSKQRNIKLSEDSKIMNY
ncbi:hypothetical protein P278_15120 [Zhouia amylolytica AD3]|uniref:Uncharacterized protein n=1 Tax=Zhouia amylolytica AD3 TaxID=1286632 RepID=W2UNS0_9FLAO|nr:hypothetical protein P278_15120 [Zhouia amylolytica AD3]